MQVVYTVTAGSKTITGKITRARAFHEVHGFLKDQGIYESVGVMAEMASIRRAIFDHSNKWRNPQGRFVLMGNLVANPSPARRLYAAVWALLWAGHDGTIYEEGEGAGDDLEAARYLLAQLFPEVPWPFLVTASATNS